ncbi:MAG: 4a-hydroxytetrahydrobiopterin dehydratase [Candidatus Nanohaloarchaea archaeon]
MDKLAGEELEQHLSEIEDGWNVVDGHRLRREFDFEDFQAALEFVNEVGEVAEKMNHHPEIEFTWGEAAVEIHTHEVDGLTEKDFELVEEIDSIL